MKLFKKEEPQPIEVAGHELSCPICYNKLFWSRRAQMNSAVSSFFNLDWTDRTATCFVCSECTHIEWFLG
ncbi:MULTISPECIES: hypothetical protein [unclassified Imperialibacter]|uniref:hypothetical protein n=1 Tax=unclassified Imperialibacter TaxID=2629706 RepID=UPI00125FCAA9|nr:MULTISPECIES: hypothetical protein [unclassified Imperialibacter]